MGLLKDMAMQKLLKFLKTAELIFCRVFLLSASFSSFDARSKVTQYLMYIYIGFLVFFTLWARDEAKEMLLSPEDVELRRQERLINIENRERKRAAEEIEKARMEKQLAEEEQKKQSQAIEKIRNESESLPHVTAITFAQKYSDNQLAANKEFLGKRFKITGQIVKIDDRQGYPYVHLYRNVDTGPDYDYAAPAIVFRKEYYDRDVRVDVKIINAIKQKNVYSHHFFNCHKPTILIP
jgi:hypothetical protein